jgi:hypothetical protein
LGLCFGDGGVDSRHNRTFFEKQMPIFVGMMQVLAVNARQAQRLQQFLIHRVQPAQFGGGFF